MNLIPLSQENYLQLYNFECENKAWFEQWVPPRPANYFNFDNFVLACETVEQEALEGKGIYCLGFVNDAIVGRFNIADIKNGQGELGYRVAKAHQGKGLATYFTGQLLNVAAEAGLESIAAQALDENAASTAILKKLGFEQTSAASERVILNDQTFHLVSFEKAIGSNS
jgi:ribosomal-protein-alanine N-acetyltransferase